MSVSLRDLVQVIDLPQGKDLAALENGLGFFESDASGCNILLHPGEDIKFIAYLTFQPGKPRGNHYHLEKIEYMLILTGRLKFELRLATNETERMEIICQQGQVVKLMPGVLHTLTALDSPVTAIEFSPQRFVASDVYKMETA